MKKIYITTHHRVINFGAALQSYALQQTLNLMGYDNKLILLEGKKSHKKNTRPIMILYDYFQKLYRFLHKKEINRGISRFNEFFEKYHNTTEKYVDFDELKRNPPVDCVYLSGSDQVFNPLDIKPHFFLQFGPENIRRISYAASISVKDVPKDKREIFKKYLSSFDCISIREDYSKGLIKEYYDKEINVNVDPSFLIEKSHWENLSTKTITKNWKKPYILIYAIYKPKWLNAYLKKISKKYDVVLLSYGSYMFLHNDKYIKEAGPREFLELIANADMVLSSSYHGNVFASVFRKPFYAIVNPDSPARIMSMLELFNLQNRILTPETEMDFNIDYSYMEKKLIEEIDRSEKYLKKSLEG